MVDREDRSSDASSGVGAPPIRDLPNITEASPATDTPVPTVSTPTRPRQVAGKYPVRELTYYQISSSDIRSIGIAQATATFFAAIGTFAFSVYLDFSKDISMAERANSPVPEFLGDVSNLAYYSWIVFWAVAFLAYVWQGNELHRIKKEHGEPSTITKLKQWWAGNG